MICQILCLLQNAHCIWFCILFSMSPKYIYISLLGLTFSARLNTFQKTSQIFAGDWQYSGCIHNSSLMPNAIFYGLMFSLLFINSRTPLPSYSLFFPLLNLLSNSMSEARLKQQHLHFMEIAGMKYTMLNFWLRLDLGQG